MSIRIFVLVMGLVLFNTSFAKGNVKKSSSNMMTRAPFNPDRFPAPVWNEAEATAWLKASEKKRKPANTTAIDESMLSKELKSYRMRIHDAKTSEAMEAIMVELDKNYESHPLDLKFYTTQILPVMAFRGLFYRLKPLFDGKSNFMHSQILTTAKSLATKANVFLPYDYVDAGYEYIASPYLKDDGSMVNGFGNEQDLQVWMVTELLPLINKSANRLNDLSLIEPVIWDQKMVFGAQSFGDNINRFKLIGEFEKQLIISSSLSSIASIAVARAYSLDKTIELYKEVGFLYGLDGFGLFNKIDGVSAEKVSKVIRKPQYAYTGILLADGKDWMKYAYNNSKSALQRLNRAWELSSDDRKNENLYTFNLGYLNVNRSEIEENLKIAKRIVMSSDVESVRSAVTGEVAQVNYSKIFLDPPKDMKAFLPVSFDKKDQAKRVVSLKDGSQKTISYRNYAFGSPKGWDVEKITPYFPSVKSNEDVFRTIRVMNHVQGNWLSIVK
jgi:hypothetical protein